MPEIVRVPLADLLLDTANPRLEDVRSSQQETALALATQQTDQILQLAEDIAEHGLDPTTLPAVVATGDRRARYQVIEGNRRVLALKALETPSLISPILSSAQSRKLSGLARKYAQDPPNAIPCVLFDSEEDARHWIVLRHTGQNDGRGLVNWGADEKDRYNARHAGTRKPAGQVIEFVEKHGHLSPEARTSPQKILTNLDRLLTSPEARRKLGVDVENGQVLALHPTEDIAKSLTRVVEDLKTGKVAVPELYRAEDRKRYAESLPRSVLPKRKTLLSTPVVLDDLTTDQRAPRPAAPRKPRTRRRSAPRTTVIPRTARVQVDHPRINAIFNELSLLSADQVPNACSVLLRVFIELSVDHFLEQKKLMTDGQMRNTPLAKRLKCVAKNLHSKGAISLKLKQAVDRVANGKSIISADVPTFNQYVHNQYVYPTARELYSAWDELEPLLEEIWS